MNFLIKEFSIKEKPTRLYMGKYLVVGQHITQKEITYLIDVSITRGIIGGMKITAGVTQGINKEDIPQEITDRIALTLMH